MRRVKPGPTFVVDSNLRRSLHHADVHDFQAVHLTPPFDPDSWGAAFQHCIDKGAARIIVDSFSDEHEGDGGVLEWHEAEIERMSKGDPDKALRMSRAAWKAPKDAHKRLRLWMWQQPVDWILCYRAKDKQDAKQQPLGMQPIGGADVIFDLLFSVLLPPRGDGRPVWTAYDGNALTHAEKQLVKMTSWFGPMFSANPQLNEDIGEQLARWAAGADVSTLTTGASAVATSSPRTSTAAAPTAPPPDVALVDLFDACDSTEMLEATKAEMKTSWGSIPIGAARTAVTKAFRAAEERVEALRQKANNA